MTRQIVPSLLLALGLLSCGPKKDTVPPDGGNKGELTPTVDTHSTSGPECVAACLESDKFKDQEVDEREKSCQAECPDPAPAADDAGATEAPAAAEG